jgi:iron complex outermembrane receptor protein
MRRVVAAAALVTGTGIAGQSAPAVGQSPQRQERVVGQLEEVIVVAQRREESAQLTPVSLVSFDAAALATLGIGSISDVQAQVPSFQVDQFPASNQTLRLFIRGVGIADVQLTQDPAVGVYLDGVYLARSTGLATEVADLKRIEVLRGPQGTLYGRNTTGGALNLVTARPDSSAPGVSLELGAGNRDRLHARAAANLPVGDTSAVKVATVRNRLDGFIDNGGPGGDFGDRDARAYRLDWRWQPQALFTLDYAWDASRIESYNYTPQAVVPGEPSGTPVDAAILSSRRFVPYGEERFSRLSTTVPLRPNDTSIDGHALTLEWLLPELTVKSITAWRELSDSSYIEFASGATPEYRVDFHAITLGARSSEPRTFDTTRTEMDQEQFSQELQFFGALGERFDYVLGLYYFREKARENWFPMHHIFSFPVIATDDSADAVNIRAEDNRIENEALALYTQLTWTHDIWGSDLHLSLGWRHSRDERSVERRFRQDNYLDYGDQVVGPLESIDFAANASRDFDDDSFALIAEYDWTEDVHAYAKYVEAYKSGGFNTRDPDPDFFSRGFDAEKNRTAELGIKLELLDNRLRVNGATFYSDFSDLQLNILLPGSISDTRVFNSGSATLTGIEMELLAMPWHGLLWGLNYAYLDAEIDDIIDPFTGEPRSFSFPSAPRHTAAVNLDYLFPVQLPGELTLNVNYNYVSDREPENPNLYRDQYNLLNGRLALADVPLWVGSLTVSTWVKNILDEDYVSFVVDNLPHASRAVLWGEPRTWGIDLRYDY